MKTLTKICFLSIKKTIKRFISILMIVLLGVGFFAGIKATSPDMQNTANKLFDKYNLYDIFIASDWGLTEDDITYLSDQGYNIEPSYSLDAIVKIDNEYAVKVMSYNKDNKMNKPIIIDGRLPENNSECVVDSGKYHDKLAIGETITVETDDLKEKELTIVGTVNSPLYISRERGSTKLLSGTISFYIYTYYDNFNIDYYTEAYVDVSDNMNRFSSKYDSLIDDNVYDLEGISNYLQDRRYKDEKEDAQNTLNEKIQEYNDSKKEAEDKISDAEKKITSASKTIQNSETALNNAKNEMSSKQKEAQDNIDALNASKVTYTAQLNEVNTSIGPLETNKANVQALIDAGVDVESNTAILNTINEQLEGLYGTKTSLEGAINTINNSINQINNAINDALKQISDAEKEISNGKKKLATAKKELADAKVKMEEELDDAQKKIDDAQKDIDELEKPEWYVLDLSSNIGFNQYKSDSERIKKIAQIFPLVFYVVAVLICLTSMTRMIEEERSELGTLKSLGYNDSSIMFKYMLYAITATLFGSAIGLTIGCYLLPKVIFNMYSMMYTLGDLVVTFNVEYSLMGTLIALFCIVTSTFYAVRKSLKEVPAELMRPKSPAAGKRVLLERITFIWKRLSFTRKVTVRNVFRYKKRFLMTIIGIAGCTGLILAGFGLQDCITNMVPNQYESIFKYQVEVTLDSDKSYAEKMNDVKSIANLEDVKDYLIVEKESIDIDNYTTDQTVTLIVPFGDISNYITLQNRKSKEQYTLGNKLIVSEKLANLLDLKVNDELDISGNKEYKSSVGAITENYIMHYIYMSKDKYNSDEFNTIFLLTNEMNSEEEKEFSNILKNYDSVSSLAFLSSSKNIFNSTMDNFKAVVVVLIVCAGLLAFAVLYNLASINISERKRELASIKVLGFYDFEVFRYINRENFILTFIGILLGLGLGNVLTGYIIKSCELDITMFDPIISWDSYIYSILITVAFTILVDITTYFALKKIKMVESLKSVE